MTFGVTIRKQSDEALKLVLKTSLFAKSFLFQHCAICYTHLIPNGKFGNILQIIGQLYNSNSYKNTIFNFHTKVIYLVSTTKPSAISQ